MNVLESVSMFLQYMFLLSFITVRKAQDEELKSIQTSVASYLKDLNLRFETIKVNKMVTLNSINIDRISAVI